MDQWAALPLELTTNMLAGGKEQYYLDPETQLYLLGIGSNPGRYYRAWTGQFASEDPIRQSHDDPNLYLYVHNNPINRLDPSGHDDNDDAKKRAQGAAAKASQQASKPPAASPASQGTQDKNASQQQAGQQTLPSKVYGGGGPVIVDPPGGYPGEPLPQRIQSPEHQQHEIKPPDEHYRYYHDSKGRDIKPNADKPTGNGRRRSRRSSH